MCGDGEEFDLDGLNPWEYEWEHSEPERIVVAHSAYPAQRHEIDVWVIRAPDRVVRFAAGEMSNLAWAFFVPVYGCPRNLRVPDHRLLVPLTQDR